MSFETFQPRLGRSPGRSPEPRSGGALGPHTGRSRPADLARWTLSPTRAV